MEAPLRRLAEGYSVNFLSYDGFPSVPGLLHRNFSSAPFPIQPPTPALPGSRLWGVSHISSAQHCVGMFFCIFFFVLVIVGVVLCPRLWYSQESKQD